VWLPAWLPARLYERSVSVHDMSMNAAAVRDEQFLATSDPQCRVIWDAANREIGVRIDNPAERGPAFTRQAVEVLLAVFGQIPGELQGPEVLPAAVKALRDPRSIVVTVIAAAAQVAAVHAGLPAVAAIIGSMAGELGGGLLDQEPDDRQGQVLSYIDFAFDVAGVLSEVRGPCDYRNSSGGDAMARLLGRYDLGKEIGRGGRESTPRPDRTRAESRGPGEPAGRRVPPTLISQDQGSKPSRSSGPHALGYPSAEQRQSPRKRGRPGPGLP
jgi:hypothetical protein